MNQASPPDNIIKFPAQPDASQSRLAAALASLLEALDEQKAAIANWRASLGDLKQSVERLGDGVGRYNGALAHLATNVGQLNQQARVLADICE